MDPADTASQEGGSLAERLSERQRQCLELVAEGYTSKQIARALALSPSTVDNHLRAALERMGLNSRADAARALREAAKSGGDKNARDSLDGTEAPRLAPSRKAPIQSWPAMALRLPPIGGVKNELSLRRRYFHVLQIALLGTMVMTAVVMTIAGLVQLFSR